MGWGERDACPEGFRGSCVMREGLGRWSSARRRSQAARLRAASWVPGFSFMVSVLFCISPCMAGQNVSGAGQNVSGLKKPAGGGGREAGDGLGAQSRRRCPVILPLGVVCPQVPPPTSRRDFLSNKIWDSFAQTGSRQQVAFGIAQRGKAIGDGSFPMMGCLCSEHDCLLVRVSVGDLEAVPCLTTAYLSSTTPKNVVI